jgi:hypothetical protein
LKILTGDAIFAQRLLLAVLKEHSVDYVFQVKDNQPEVLDAVKETFRERQSKEPAAQSRSKKGCVRDKPKKFLKRLGFLK